MPRTPSGTARNIRIPDPLWDQAKEKAAAEGTDTSATVRTILKKHVEGAVQVELSAPIIRMVQRHAERRSITFDQALMDCALEGADALYHQDVKK